MIYANLLHQTEKDLIEFGFDDSGKRVFFAVQIENEGRKGRWFRPSAR
jgi:hypothetical protein